MKIKNDFITNSSSTSYIVLIPQSYKFDKDKYPPIKKEAMDHFDEGAEFNDKIILSFINKTIELLKNGSSIFYNELEDDNECLGWFCLFDILSNYIIAEAEIPTDYYTGFQGAKEKDVINVLTLNQNLDNLLKSLIKGVNNETKKK